MKSKQFLSLLLVSILMGCFPVSLAAGELQPRLDKRIFFPDISIDVAPPTLWSCNRMNLPELRENRTFAAEIVFLKTR